MKSNGSPKGQDQMKDDCSPSQSHRLSRGSGRLNRGEIKTDHLDEANGHINEGEARSVMSFIQNYLSVTYS